MELAIHYIWGKADGSIGYPPTFNQLIPTLFKATELFPISGFYKEFSYLKEEKLFQVFLSTKKTICDDTKTRRRR